jgi:hypothetical protein
VIDSANKRLQRHEKQSVLIEPPLGDDSMTVCQELRALQRDLQILRRVVKIQKRTQRDQILLNVENAAFMISWYCNVNDCVQEFLTCP